MKLLKNRLVIIWCSVRSAVIVGVGGSSACFATRNRLDGPGLESRWRRDLPCPSRPFLFPTQPLVQNVLGPCWG